MTAPASWIERRGGRNGRASWVRLACCCLACAPLSLAAASADEAPRLLSTTGGKGQAAVSLPELRKRAGAGDREACLQLGLRFETGDEVTQDFDQARQLYERAAAAGQTTAIYRLGKLAQDGLGAEADPTRAEELYRLAAMADVPLAQYNLGAMLVSARGVGRDYVEGLAWLILATRHHVPGDGEQRVRAHLAGQPQVIAAAEKRAAELARQVDAHRGAKTTWTPPPAAPRSKGVEQASPAVERPIFAPPSVEPPRMEPPKIELAPPAPPAPVAPAVTTGTGQP